MTVIIVNIKLDFSNNHTLTLKNLLVGYKITNMPDPGMSSEAILQYADLSNAGGVILHSPINKMSIFTLLCGAASRQELSPRDNRGNAVRVGRRRKMFCENLGGAPAGDVTRPVCEKSGGMKIS